MTVDCELDDGWEDMKRGAWGGGIRELDETAPVSTVVSPTSEVTGSGAMRGVRIPCTSVSMQQVRSVVSCVMHEIVL